LQRRLAEVEPPLPQQAVGSRAAALASLAVALRLNCDGDFWRLARRGLTITHAALKAHHASPDRIIAYHHKYSGLFQLKRLDETEEVRHCSLWPGHRNSLNR
jgi:hypothetical protein